METWTWCSPAPAREWGGLSKGPVVFISASVWGEAGPPALGLKPVRSVPPHVALAPLEQLSPRRSSGSARPPAVSPLGEAGAAPSPSPLSPGSAALHGQTSWGLLPTLVPPSSPAPVSRLCPCYLPLTCVPRCSVVSLQSRCGRARRLPRHLGATAASLSLCDISVTYSICP